MSDSQSSFTHLRRDFLTTAASGLGGAALTAMLTADGALGAEAGSQQAPLATRRTHFEPKAKSCIFIFNAGAPSQLDLFNYRPELNRLDGQALPESLLEGVRFAFIEKETARLMAARRNFRQNGESGMWFSELLPKIATCADDICMINSMHTDQFNHHPGQLMMQCGQAQFGLPSMGSWLSYGLGTENQNLPSYVVLTAGRGSSGGATLWSSGYLPSVHAGVLLRNQGPPILNLELPPGLPRSLERHGLDAIRALNEQNFQRMQDPEIASRIANYELSFRMQSAAPELTDISGETAATLEAYGVNRSEPKERASRVGSGAHYPSFARNCLLARRMVERGVRFVNIIFASWDHHSKLDRELAYNAGCVDQPVAALIKDLKQRGLLDETLVVFGGEFGRTPLGENRNNSKNVTGRDHHPNAFSMFMAGGGSRAGYTHGETDEIGWNPIVDPVHVNDFQATLLKQFGLNHKKLTFRHQGADKRLTNITREAHVIDELIG
ncbi:DUF1501 domain-containing protein [Fuerstiella marisgermanici]|uniref:Sulfatase n=1 Tax=Fuerstiella marisgermanici TaxID=1891926 RepID=A0A1P8WMQ1_9PLAN|nr:DUF1501 domain-containing protein [Fuerstiella marisgermanici]APZ95336.1 hypothetical protein Fuma_04992 [Fuerstiella marisgermanici]